MSIKLVSLDDPDWQELLRKHPPGLFSSERWCRTIADFYDFPTGAVVAEDGGFPFAVVDDHRGARHLIFPFSDACESVGPFDLARLAEDARTNERSWVIRSPLQADGSISYGVHQSIDLAGGADALARSRIHRLKHLRRVRHAASVGVVSRVAHESSAIAESFYPIYAAFRKERLGLLPQSRAFFQRLGEVYFPNDGFVVIAEYAGEVVGAALVLRHAESLYLKYTATDYRFRSFGISNTLYQVAIERGTELGCERLDVGLSGSDSLSRFKAGVGAEAHPLYRTSFGPPERKEGVAFSAALGRITEIACDPSLPLRIVEETGAALYRYFA